MYTLTFYEKREIIVLEYKNKHEYKLREQNRGSSLWKNFRKRKKLE